MRENAPSRTAEMVCLIRAAEQRRPAGERVLDDPYARHFLGPISRATLATVEATGRLSEQIETAALGLVPYVLCRHRFIDDGLAAFLADPSPGRVILLGAGYDSRAWRFAEALAGRPLIEVDHPATAGRKAEVISGISLPPLNRQVVVTDFQGAPLSEVLSDAGVLPGERTFFVWEGVSMYLSRDAVKSTLRAAATMGGPGSELAMDLWFLLDGPDISATAHRVSSGLLSILGEPVTFGIHPEDIGDFLRRQGLTAIDVATPDELSRRYLRDGRPIYPAAYTVRARIGASSE